MHHRAFSVVSLLVAAFLWLLPATAAERKAPKEIAGIRLGDHLEGCRHLLHMESMMPIRHQEYLQEVEIGELPGFKSGTVQVGTCADPGHIVRIKLKYAQSGKRFYDELLRRFKERFGEAAEWKGDPFGAIQAWKWAFTDEQGHRIVMILQHSDDPDYKMGNTIKLTDMTLLEREEACFEKQQRGDRKRQAHKKHHWSGGQGTDFDIFIPR